eukprot:Hpha_TRINITY_DN23067_c0_g1::TRINITY_DN23067_c0_g1_i1::g.109294::m.109294
MAEKRKRGEEDQPREALGKLQGKRAVVTGAGSGMGRAIALAFAREGATVVIAGRRVDALKITVDAAASLPGKVVSKQCDISKEESVEGLVTEAKRLMGGIDILVNNAGMNVPQRKLKELKTSDWKAVIDTNLGGTFNVTQAVLPTMRDQRCGTIINVTSIAGKRASVLAGSSYVASKYGMNGLGNMINLEEGPNGIRCTNICPGEVATEILDKRPVPPPPEKRRQMAQPEDIGECAVLVASLPQRVFIPELTVTGITTLDLAM